VVQLGKFIRPCEILDLAILDFRALHSRKQCHFARSGRDVKFELEVRGSARFSAMILSHPENFVSHGSCNVGIPGAENAVHDTAAFCCDTVP
jgi:hypothetical protein